MKYIEKYWIGIVCILFFFALVKPAVCFFIFGALIAYIIVSSILFLRSLHIYGKTAVGKILTYQKGSRGSKTPVIEFKTLNGDIISEQPFVYTSTDLSKIRTYKNLIDTEVKVLYDPKNPTKFVLADESGFNNLVLTFGLLVALSFIVVSIFGLLGYIKF